MLNKEEIRAWQNNCVPWWLIEGREHLVREVKDASDMLVYAGEQGWIRHGGKSFCDKEVYRLPPDYQPEPVGRWVECEVQEWIGHYRFEHPSGIRCVLHEAPGMVGFGGVRYGKLGWNRSLCHKVEDFSEVPVAPTHVRFWVEE